MPSSSGCLGSERNTEWIGSMTERKLGLDPLSPHLVVTIFIALLLHLRTAEAVLSAAARQAFLDGHNRCRDETGHKMLHLVWSDSIAKFAQNITEEMAEKCDFTVNKLGQRLRSVKGFEGQRLSYYFARFGAQSEMEDAIKFYRGSTYDEMVEKNGASTRTNNRPYIRPGPPRGRNPDGVLILKPAEKKAALDAHNRCRLEKTGVRMPEMTWDKALAAFAQKYAERLAVTCKLKHSTGPERQRIPGYVGQQAGENLAQISSRGTQVSVADDLKRAVEALCYEAKFYEIGSHFCRATPLRRLEGYDTCGHYTQIVWSKTTKVGCGYAPCSGREGPAFIMACNYIESQTPGRPYDYRQSSIYPLKFVSSTRLEDLEEPISYPKDGSWPSNPGPSVRQKPDSYYTNQPQGPPDSPTNIQEKEGEPVSPCSAGNTICQGLLVRTLSLIFVLCWHNLGLNPRNAN